MLVARSDSAEVQAIPVYGGQSQFLDSSTALRRELGHAEEAITVEIMQRLPVPEIDTPLENLVRLRNDPAFRSALDDVLEWKQQKAPGIVLAEDRHSAIAAAMRDFDRLTKAYAAAMESQGYKKAGTVGSIFFALLKHDPVDLIKEAAVSFREIREPCWKKLTEMEFAPGGLVYHFQRCDWQIGAALRTIPAAIRALVRCAFARPILQKAIPGTTEPAGRANDRPGDRPGAVGLGRHARLALAIGKEKQSAIHTSRKSCLAASMPF